MQEKNMTSIFSSQCEINQSLLGSKTGDTSIANNSTPQHPQPPRHIIWHRAFDLR
ncbi:hypothetical protein M378DRAFT_167942, partial [Amanita muscaria Koide BX008]